jgi:hypothetical protein
VPPLDLDSQFLASKVMYGDPADAAFSGNLRVGSSPSQVSAVAGEWFLGTDLPSLVSGEGYSVNYYDPSGNVFGGGLSYLQVNQAAVGDCTLMASLAEVASAATRPPAVTPCTATPSSATARYCSRTSRSGA